MLWEGKQIGKHREICQSAIRREQCQGKGVPIWSLKGKLYVQKVRKVLCYPIFLLLNKVQNFAVLFIWYFTIVVPEHGKVCQSVGFEDSTGT